jgi:hypothetical protein
MMKHEIFRELILYICPAFDNVLIRAGTTIRRWIIKKYIKRYLEIRNKLVKAKLKIYFSFDL